MKVKYRFSILSGTLTVSVENPRETQVEGVLVLPTHPVCIVVCTGEANYCMFVHSYSEAAPAFQKWLGHCK